LILSDLPPQEVQRRLKTHGLRLRTGPVVTNIRSQLPLVAAGLTLHYSQFPVESEGSFADFHIRIVQPGLRRWFRPQVLFQSDEDEPFAPLPADQAFPMLEWGLNWCVSSHCHQFLMIHSAVVEMHGRALIMPAPPGSGKSTLCAGLICRGWRLLSDELTLIDPATGAIVPVPRPVSLKNASIDIVRAFAPGAVLGPAVQDTLKGTVAHMSPPTESVRHAAETAMPAWIVLPRYTAGAPATLTPLSKARAFLHLADNSFNYHVHGKNGFDAIGKVIDACECYEFSYADLADAERVFAQLASTTA
jgi:HprK-related kinase A